MCGIVAEHGGSDPEQLERMLERLAHRGPDDRGTVRVDGSWLGHRRLSIVDVGGGRQPLCTPDESAWLVGNGEVYNHEEVRARLGDRELLTTSDNEVALHLIDERGAGGLAELSGMFAFVMAGRDGRFVAARDPVGIKPLYWAQRNGAVRFASEMHAFDPEWQAAVEPFPPGHSWTPEDGLRRFASAVPAAREPVTDREELLTGTRETLVRAVRQQMMGDVNVGVFLSGGLDSSLVAAIASRIANERGRRLQTFAVGTEASPDLAAARTVAEHLGCDHVEVTYTAAEALESLPNVVRAIESFDPGLVRSAVPNYMLARTTRQHVKVVLTGEGADELFAGYDYMREFTDDDALHAELERTVRSLHNLNLQRCDRVTMAHAVEARVPFLDRNVIAWALRIPPGEKQGMPEKRLLREAFTGWLPDELLWRAKAEFGDGSGARDVLSQAVEATVSDAEFEAERGAVEPALRTKEEVAYYRVWREHLQGISPERTLSRFARA
jgi:asparagine synthase (glutamine-hydrolysing)